MPTSGLILVFAVRTVFAGKGLVRDILKSIYIHYF